MSVPPPSAGTPSGIVTLLTDFGSRDPFVGIMKGVLLALSPSLRTVDLTHEIAPQDVASAAFWLARSFVYFPAGTVHLAVVDPGVGSSRLALAAVAQGHYFVGPDNGLLADVLGEADAIHQIDAASMTERLHGALPWAAPPGAARGGAARPSATFHGRDVFAVAAALLGAGAELGALGPQLDRSALSGGASKPAAPMGAGNPETAGQVAVVDRFGNLITNINWSPADGDAHVRLGERRLRWVSNYSEAALGECVALLGSFGTIEIAVRCGSAAEDLGVGRGEPVQVTR